MDVTKTGPPNGGWGWVIVAALALINVTNHSIVSVFGLLFGSQLKEMGLETFTASLMANINSSVLNFSGLLIGPAVKCFKPHKVASIGCIMVSFGLMLCAFATQGWHFIIGYGLFVGIGLGLISPAAFLVVHSYFSSKRGRAVGVYLAGAGLGQVFLPHVVRIFLENYGYHFAVMAMSILSLTGLIGTLLLKPFKHNNHQQIKLYLENIEKGEKNESTMEVNVENVHTNDSIKKSRKQKYNEAAFIISNNNNVAYQEPSETLSQKILKNINQRLVMAMDLELLNDPVFWSIIIGMALVYTSSITFTMVFPNFLQYSVGFTKSTTANCMSIMAGADIICRLLLPCITDVLKVPYRFIFLLGTIGLLISRAALAESVNPTSIIVMSVFTGMAKSATVLNNNLTISAHVQSSRLGGALGLSAFSKGILVITVGQLLGWIRDFSGSYILCLHAQNIMLLLVVAVWSVEMFLRNRQHVKEKRILKQQIATDVEQQPLQREK